MTMYTIFKRFLVSVAVFLCLVSSSQASSTTTQDGAKKTSLTPEDQARIDAFKRMLQAEASLTRKIKSDLAIVALKKFQQGDIKKDRMNNLNLRIKGKNPNSIHTRKIHSEEKRYFYSNSKMEFATNLKEFQDYLDV